MRGLLLAWKHRISIVYDVEERRKEKAEHEIFRLCLHEVFARRRALVPLQEYKSSDAIWLLFWVYKCAFFCFVLFCFVTLRDKC